MERSVILFYRRLLLFIFYDFQVKRCSVRLYSHLSCRGLMFYLSYLYLFTYTGVQRDFHITWCSCRSTITQRAPLVKQEQPTIPERLGSLPGCCEVCVAQSIATFVYWLDLIDDPIDDLFARETNTL